MLERMIVGFVDWFIRPLGYEIWPTGMVQDLIMDNISLNLDRLNFKMRDGDSFISTKTEYVAAEKEDNVIKADFTT